MSTITSVHARTINLEHDATQPVPHVGCHAADLVCGGQGGHQQALLVEDDPAVYEGVASGIAVYGTWTPLFTGHDVSADE